MNYWQKNPHTRRILQVLTFEVIAILLITIGAMALTASTFAGGLGFAIVNSLVAICWNYVYNTLFEHWELKQKVKGRSILRRAVYAIGYELGLVVMLVPFMAYWFSISLMQALIADIGILFFFLAYVFVYNWCFDKIFGLPYSSATKA